MVVLPISLRPCSRQCLPAKAVKAAADIQATVLESRYEPIRSKLRSAYARTQMLPPRLIKTPSKPSTVPRQDEQESVYRTFCDSAVPVHFSLSPKHRACRISNPYRVSREVCQRHKERRVSRSPGPRTLLNSLFASGIRLPTKSGPINAIHSK